MICPYCKKQMQKTKDIIEQDNIEFDVYECKKCGERLMDMKQLNKLANKYRKLKGAKQVKFAQWGNSLALRISKDLVNELSLKPGKGGLMYKEGKELRIIVG
jgi:Zn-finger nucleic acid-binding protein